MEYNNMLTRFWLAGPFYARPGDSDVSTFPGSGTPTATDTDDFGTNDQIVNLGTKIHKFGRRRTPLLSYLMDGIVQENTEQETFGHLEQPHNPEFVEYTGATESSQASPITIANFNRLVEGQVIFFVDSKRAVRVSATPSTSAVAIAGATNLNFGTLGTPLLTNGEKGILLPRHVEQGSTIGDFVEYGRVQYDFQTSIIEEPVITTGTRAAQRLRSGKGVWQDAFDEVTDGLKRKMQAGFMMQGALAPTAGTSHPIHASSSVDAWTTLNRFIFNRRFTRFDLEEMILALGRQNEMPSNPDDPRPMELVIPCSKRLKAQITGWASEFLHLTQEERGMFGPEVTRVRVGTGDIVMIMPLDMFDKDPTLEGRFWMFDRRDIKYRALADVENRDIRYFPNATFDPGNIDVNGGRILGEFGLEFFNKEGFASAEGITF